MKADIDNWTKQRLEQWVDDAVSRYEMADISPYYAFSSITSILMVTALKLLAASDVTPEEIGYRTVEMVKRLRTAEQRRTRTTQ